MIKSIQLIQNQNNALLEQVCCTWTLSDNNDFDLNVAISPSSYEHYILKICSEDSFVSDTEQDLFKGKRSYQLSKDEFALTINQEPIQTIAYIPHDDTKCLNIVIDGQYFDHCLLYVEFSLKLAFAGQVRTLPNFGFEYDSITKEMEDMIEYVQSYASKYFFSQEIDENKTKVLHKQKTEHLEFNSLLKTLGKIATVYEQELGFFKTNAYFKLKQEGIVDNFYRIKSFSPETLHYIANHPDELTPFDDETGIKFRGRNYIPKHTLMITNVRDLSIYENRALVSFLHKIINDIKAISLAIQANYHNYSNQFASFIKSYEGILNFNAITDEEKKKLSDLRTRLVRLYSQYRTLLPVEEIGVKKIPRPTPVFLSVPAYRLIYTQMKQWYSLDITTIESNAFIINAIYKSRLYEYYCLLKIVKAFESNGFTFTGNQKSEDDYTSLYSTFEPEFNEIFNLDSESYAAKVIYQPVIYSQREGNTGLYRSTSLIVNNITSPIWGSESYEHFYTPDFAIVVTNKQTQIKSVLLIDAKHKDLESVKLQDIIPCTVKYQLSVKPIKETTKYIGLEILCGKGKQADTFSPFDNIHNPRSEEVIENAFVKVLTLNENSQNCNYQLQEELFK